MTLGPLIGQGRTAEIYAYESDKVIKLYHSHIDESWIDHEHKINQIANQYNCPSPKVYEKIKIEERVGIIFERIDGSTVTDLLKKPWNKAEHIAMRTAAVHANIHKVSFGSSGHPFDENSIDLPRQNDYFKSKINDTDALSPEEKSEIIDYLSRLPEKLILCHGDLHTDNYIVMNRKHYVIDWTNAYIGNPASDIARSLLMMESPYGKEFLPPLIRPFISFIVHAYNKSFLRTYLSINNIKQGEINAWRLPVAAARLHENVPEEREWLLSIIQKELEKEKYH